MQLQRQAGNRATALLYEQRGTVSPVQRQSDSEDSETDGSETDEEQVDDVDFTYIEREKGAFLHVGPQRGKKVAGERLPRGTDLNIVEKRGDFLRVEVAGGRSDVFGRTGWIRAQHTKSAPGEGGKTKGRGAGAYRQITDTDVEVLATEGNTRRRFDKVESRSNETPGEAAMSSAAGIAKGAALAGLDAVTAPVGVPVGTIVGGIDTINSIRQEHAQGHGLRETAKQGVSQAVGQAHWSVALAGDAVGLLRTLKDTVTGEFDTKQAERVRAGMQKVQNDINAFRAAARMARADRDSIGAEQLDDRAEALQAQLDEVEAQLSDTRIAESVRLL